MSVKSKYEFLEQAYPGMLEGIGMLIQKYKISSRFSSLKVSVDEKVMLERAKELCELKIVELWDHQDTLQFKALCSSYFDIAAQLEIETDDEYFIYEQIKLISFGYLGEHWHFVRQYLNVRKSNYDNLPNSIDWNQRLLTLSFKALINLIRKDNWKDVEQAIEIINQLRNEQAKFENEFLNQVGENSKPYGAAELVALYHFAKSVEVLGQYLVEGRPLDIESQLHYHITLSGDYATKSGNISLNLLFQFYEAFTIKVVRNTIWYTTRGINNWVTKFNKFISNREEKGTFELLYPQRESIIEGELFNPAHRAIVINLPTSSGKTMIAEYRILQALNQFKQSGGWVAYVVPTKALVNQIYIQLNKDFGSIGIKVEKASGAIDLDGFEQVLVENGGNSTDFDVLITTYEKLSLLVRQGLGTTSERPLVLAVVDEAHNIEEEKRGLNLEFLLSTIKNDCEEANFLLMTPDITNSTEIVDWLAGERGKVINLELDWWQPNERIVGAIQVEGRARKYDIYLKTLHTDKGTYDIGTGIPLANFENATSTKSEVCSSKVKISTAISSVLIDINSPIIVLASNVQETYTIAESLFNDCNNSFETDDDVELLIKLIQSELGVGFPLAKYLTKRIAVHSSALPDEVKFLVEDLMAKEKLQVLVSTTTIAQGINFPVSAVVLGAYNYPFTTEMPVRDFWNLAGRVGRAGQQNMGWVGIAIQNDEDLLKVAKYVTKASDDLHSQLVNAIDSILRHQDQDFSRWLYIDERWSAILQYISHLRKQTEQQNVFLAQLEQKLQSTLGYRQLSPEKKLFLRERIRSYASTLTLADAKRSDETGFSSISVRQMTGQLARSGLTPNDWNKNQLFSEQNQSMQKLIGIMFDTYEIRKSVQELSQGENVLDRSSIARLIIDWVNGKDIASIALKFYPNDESQRAIQKATKALYKVVANSATWGIAALQKMPTSGVNWETLSEIEKKRMANLPAYLHYGVNTDEGVLMRKNNIPRSIANSLGKLFSASVKGEIFSQPSSSVAEWINQQDIKVWDAAKPLNSKLSAQDYRDIWMKLNGMNS